MRVLVAGPYPPMPGPASRHTLALVARLVEQGEEVEVVSPVPSAAHHHEPLRGVWGALTLARRAYAYRALVLHLEPGLPLRPSVLAPLECLALGAALARWRHVTLSLEDLSAVPVPLGGRSARQLWRRADRVVVTTDFERHRLHREGGVALERVVVREGDEGGFAALGGGGGSGVGRAAPFGPATAQQLRLALMGQVRARAAVERRRVEAMPAAPEEAADTGPTTPAAWALTLVKKGVRHLLGEHADAVLGPLYRLRLAVAGTVRRALARGRSARSTPPAGGGVAGTDAGDANSVAAEEARER